jgi:hypothetical protein
VKLLSRRWRREAELACDDAAVTATGEPLAMAAAISRVQGHPVNLAASPRPPLPAVTLAFADEAACPPEARIERLIRHAEGAALLAARRESPAQRALTWSATFALAGVGLALALSPQVICAAHCSLEAVARLLP